MGTKDTITKDYMADNRVFADVFNHMLYKGKNVIDPDTLHPLDTTALAVPYGSGTSEVPVQKFRDEFKSLNVIQEFIFSLGLRTSRNRTLQCRSRTWSMMH